jgi:N-acyl amino acid synthase of PEP-CTERM/exosortase system
MRQRSAIAEEPPYDPWTGAARQHRFQTVLADTQVSRRVSFRLRYQVFCEEMGFYDARSFPSGLERDVYDPASTIFLVWDHLTSRWAGTMRLVHAKKSTLPSEAICWPARLLALEENRSQSVEFSRLCVAREFRRVHTASYSVWTDDEEPRNRAAATLFTQVDDEILLRLILGFIAWASDNGVSYCYLLINSALARVLKRLHVPLTVAGPEVEHRGIRRPYRTHVETVLGAMRKNLPQVSRIMERAEPYLSHRDHWETTTRRTD